MAETKKSIEKMTIAEILSDEDATERLRELMGHDAAALRLVNLTFNTPTTLMSQMTVLPKRHALLFSMMEALDVVTVINPKRVKSLPTLFRESFYRHQRSVGGVHLNSARMLAEAQLNTEEEEAEGGGEEME